MFKRALALFLSFVMVFSLLPVSAFAEEASGESIVAEGEQVTAPEKEETVTETTVPEESIPEVDEPELTVISGTIPMQVNPLYAGLVSVEDIPAAEPIAPLSDPVYGTTAEAVSVIREAMKARVNQFDVYFMAEEQDFAALHKELFNNAMTHTGVSTEGDYLLFQYAAYGGGISGYYDSQGNLCMTFTYSLMYHDTAEQQDAMDAAVASLLSQLNLYGKSDYEKICGIYDWMCANITYDYDNLEDDNYTLMYTAYAALINRTAVCQGYANLFYRLALELGVDSRIISGIGISNTGNGPHAWNIVKLGGSYYDMDATWDATWKQAGLDYEWFLKNEEDFSADHVRNAEYSTSAFHASYPMATEDFDPIVGSGTCGANLTWTLDYQGTLTISGTGEMDNYLLHAAPWYDWYDTGEMFDYTVKSVRIEEGVTSISTTAFLSHCGLMSISIPNSLVCIGDSAFWNCTSLTSVTIPAGVTSIGPAAFLDCISLTEILVDDANPNYSSMDGILFNKDKTTLVSYLETKVGAYTIPDTVKNIDGSAFYNCENLTSVTIPSSVTGIEDGAFHSCTGLTTIIFEGNAPSFGTYYGDVFYDDVFSNVTATAYYPADNDTWTSDKLKDYGGNLTWEAYGSGFAGLASGTCGANLTWVLDQKGVLTVSGEGRMADYSSFGAPWDDYRNSIVTVIIEEGVTSIGDNAFLWSPNLKTVELPDGLLSIGKCAFQQTGLNAILLPDTLTTIKPLAFISCPFSSVTIPSNVAEIGYSAFEDCSSLEEIIVHKDNKAFSDLEGVLMSKDGTELIQYPVAKRDTVYAIPETVSHVREYAFSRCNLTEIVIPSGVIDIETGAFSECMEMLRFSVDPNNANYTSGDSGELMSKDKTTLICYPNGSDLDVYTVPNNVTYLSIYAFLGSSLKQIVLPDSVTSAGFGAFTYCTKLETVDLANIEAISDYMFQTCESLSSITIPASVQRVGNDCFYRCSNLKSVTFMGDAPTFGATFFSNVTATAYYPADNDTWTSDVMQNYGGTITWVAYGNEPSTVSVSTPQELMDALAEGKKAITVAADMETDAGVQLQGVSLEVAENVTLTLNEDLYINPESTLTVNGMLISNKGITVEGALNIENRMENYAPFWVVNGGKVTVGENAVFDSYEVFHIGFGDANAISSLSVNGTLNSYNYFNITDKGRVSVNGTFNNAASAMGFGFIEIHGAMTVAGTLNNDTIHGISLDGYLDITGSYAGTGPVSVNAFNHDVQLDGVGENANIRYCCGVDSLQTLKAAIAEAGNYPYLYIDIFGSFDINEAITLPENVEVCLSGQYENEITLQVLSNGTLTNQNKMTIESFAALNFAEGSLFRNNGDVMVCSGSLNVEGTYASTNGMGTVKVDLYRGGSVSGVEVSSNVTVENFEELRSALNAASNMEGVQVNIDVCSTISLNHMITIPVNTVLSVIGDPGNEVELIVPYATVLENKGVLAFNCANLVVRSEGNLNNEGELIFNAQPHGFGGADIDGYFSNNGTCWVNTGACLTVNAGGIAHNPGNFHVGFGEGQISTLCVEGILRNYSYLNLTEYADVTVSGSLENLRASDTSGYTEIKGQVEITGSLINRSDIRVTGELNVSGMTINEQSITVDGGTLIVAEHSGNGRITKILNNEDTVISVPDNVYNIRLLYVVDSLEDLKAAIVAANHSEWMEADVIASVMLDEDTEIPYSMGINLCDMMENPVTLTVPTGTTLTLFGNINIHRGATLEIQNGAVLDNRSGIHVYGGTLNNEGTYSGDEGVVNVDMETGGTVNHAPMRYYSVITDLDQLEAALAAAKDLDAGVMLEICNNIRIDKDLEIPAHVTVFVVGGIGMTVTVANGTTLVNQGKIEIGGVATLQNEGKLINNGNMVVWPYCAFRNAGVLEGNKPLIYLDYEHVAVNTEAELIDAMANEALWTISVASPIELTDELVVSKTVYVLEGGALTVPEGVTLNLENAYMKVDGGAVTVEEGALLINNGSIDLISGMLTVAEDDAYEGYGNISYTLDINNTLRVPEHANIQYVAEARSQEELEEMIAFASDLGWLNIYLMDGFAISKDLTIPGNVSLTFAGAREEAAEYTVSGANLTNNGDIYIGENTILTIEEDALLQNEGSIYVAGALHIYGSYASENNCIVQASLLNGEVTGVEFAYSNDMSDFETLKRFLELATQTDNEVRIGLSGYVQIEENITIPENVELHICYGSDTRVIVCEDVELTNNGHIIVEDNSTLVNEGILNNLGSLEIYEGSSLIDNGTFTGNDPVFGDTGNFAAPATEEELIAALADEDVIEIFLEVPIELSGSLLVDSTKMIYIGENGALTVPADITLNLEGSMYLIGGQFTVADDAILINNGWINVTTGSMTVAKNAQYQGYGTIVRMIDDNTLVAPDHAYISYAGMASTLEELENILPRTAGLSWVEVQMVEGFAITRDITIPENVSLYLLGYTDEIVEYTVSGATVTNLGQINVSSEAVLTIAEDACLQNECGICVEGVLNMNGTYASENGAIVEANLTSGHVNGMEYLYFAGTDNFEMLQDLLPLAEQTDNDVRISINGILDITEDITVGENVRLDICNGDMTVITVCEGVTLTNNGRTVVNAESTLCNNGTINNLGALEICEYAYLYDNGVIEGNPPVFITSQTSVTVETEADLIAALYDDTIYEITVNGSFTLSGNLFVPYGKTVTISGGAVVTVPEGLMLYIEGNGTVTMTEAGALVISENASLHNWSVLNVMGGSLIVKGEYLDEGELYVSAAEDATYIEGVESYHISYVHQVSDLAGLKAAAEAAEGFQNFHLVKVIAPFDITENIIIPGNMTVEFQLFEAENCSVAIMEDVTVENYGLIYLNGYSVMNILEGAEFSNYGQFLLYAEEGGQLNVHAGGSFANKPYAYLNVAYGTMTVEENGYTAEEYSTIMFDVVFGSISGVDKSLIHAYGEARDVSELHAIADAGYTSFELDICSEMKLEKDLTLDENDRLNFYNDAVMTVPAEVTLTVNGAVNVNWECALLIEEGGKLINNGMIFVEMAVLDVMGDYSGDGIVPMRSEYGQIGVAGVPKSSIEAIFDYVIDVDTLVDAMTSGYKSADVIITGDIVLRDSLTVPVGFNLHIADYRTDIAVYARSIAARSTCASLTIPEGRTLTVEGNLSNYGNMIVEQAAELCNKEAGIIENNGSLVVEEAASMVNEGLLTNAGAIVVEPEAALVNNGCIETGGGTTLSVGGEYSGIGEVNVDMTNGTVLEGIDSDAINMNGEVDGEDALRQILNAGYSSGNVTVSENVTLTENLTIPVSFTVCLTNGAALVVPAETALTVEGQLLIQEAATMTVAGKLEVLQSGSVDVQHGVLTVEQDAECIFHENIALFDGTGTINGLEKKDLILQSYVTDTDSFAQNVAIADDYNYVIVYVENEFHLNSNITIPENMGVGLTGSDEMNGNLVIPANVTLTNNGVIEVGLFGGLIIQDQGCLVNNGKVFVYDGMFVVEEGGTVMGDKPEGVPVAMIGDTKYTSVADALNSAEEGDTVTLVADVFEMNLVVRKGVTLNLNGYTLNTDYIFAVNGANIVDESESNTGLLKADADCVLISKANAQLPVWNGEGYVFSKVTYLKGILAQNENMLQFVFLPQFQSVATELLKDGADDNKVTVEVRVSWESTQGREYRNLVYNNQQVAQGISSGGAFLLTFSGFSKLKLTSGIVIEAVVYSETGVSVASEAVVVNVANNS